MIVREKISGKNVNYPNKDITKAIVGHIGDEEYYFIDKLAQPPYDYRTHKIVKLEEYTTELKYPHLPIFRISYTTEALSNEEIITHLNDALGNYLDENYPIWERTKHLGVSAQILDGNEAYLPYRPYIESMHLWMENCRSERDAMEDSLPELPDFNFSPRP